MFWSLKPTLRTSRGDDKLDGEGEGELERLDESSVQAWAQILEAGRTTRPAGDAVTEARGAQQRVLLDVRYFGSNQ